MPTAYNPRNPLHLLLDPEGKVLSLPLHEVEKIAKELASELSLLEGLGPHRGSGREKVQEQVRQKYKDRYADADKAGKKQIIIQMQNEYRAEVLKHERLMGDEREKAQDKINDWKAKNKVVLDFLAKIRPGVKLFFQTALGPGESRVLETRVQEIARKAKKYNLLERGSWKWTAEGKDMLRRAGFDLDETKRNSALAVEEIRARGEIEKEIQQAQKSLTTVREQLKQKQKAFDKGMEWLSGKRPDRLTEHEKQQVGRANKRLGQLRTELEHLQESLVNLEDHVEMLKFQKGQREILNIPLEPHGESRTKLIETAYQSQQWSKDLTIDDVVLTTKQWGLKALRDIPIDHLVWIATGARVRKTVTRRDRGAPVEVKKIHIVDYNSYTFRVVREYLDSSNGRKRLRDYYGNVGEEYIRVLTGQAPEMAERSATIKAGLAPQDKGALRRQLQESLENFKKTGEAVHLYDRALNLGMSPEEAARYVEWAEQEGPEGGRWRVPVAFQEAGHLSREQREELADEDYLTERDYLRRQLAQLTPEQFMDLMWPPSDPQRGYRDDELTAAKKKYYGLRSRVLQTPVGEKAGWVPHDPKWKQLDPKYEGAWRVALNILKKVEQAENRPQLEALRQRLVELFHEREDPEGDALDAREGETPTGVDMAGFTETHDHPLIQYIHNRLVERYNLFAHPDVVAEPISYEENENLSPSEVPFPEAEMPESSSFVNPEAAATEEDIAEYRRKRRVSPAYPPPGISPYPKEPPMTNPTPFIPPREE